MTYLNIYDYPSLLETVLNYSNETLPFFKSSYFTLWDLSNYYQWAYEANLKSFKFHNLWLSWDQTHYNREPMNQMSTFDPFFPHHNKGVLPPFNFWYLNLAEIIQLLPSHKSLNVPQHSLLEVARIIQFFETTRFIEASYKNLDIGFKEYPYLTFIITPAEILLYDLQYKLLCKVDLISSKISYVGKQVTEAGNFFTYCKNVLFSVVKIFPKTEEWVQRFWQRKYLRNSNPQMTRESAPLGKAVEYFRNISSSFINDKQFINLKKEYMKKYDIDPNNETAYKSFTFKVIRVANPYYLKWGNRHIITKKNVRWEDVKTPKTFTILEDEYYNIHNVSTPLLFKEGANLLQELRALSKKYYKRPSTKYAGENPYWNTGSFSAAMNVTRRNLSGPWRRTADTIVNVDIPTVMPIDAPVKNGSIFVDHEVKGPTFFSKKKNHQFFRNLFRHTKWKSTRFLIRSPDEFLWNHTPADRQKLKNLQSLIETEVVKEVLYRKGLIYPFNDWKDKTDVHYRPYEYLHKDRLHRLINYYIKAHASYVATRINMSFMELLLDPRKTLQERMHIGWLYVDAFKASIPKGYSGPLQQQFKEISTLFKRFRKVAYKSIDYYYYKNLPEDMIEDLKSIEYVNARKQRLYRENTAHKELRIVQEIFTEYYHEFKDIWDQLFKRKYLDRSKTKYILEPTQYNKFGEGVWFIKDKPFSKQLDVFHQEVFYFLQNLKLVLNSRTKEFDLDYNLLELGENKFENKKDFLTLENGTWLRKTRHKRWWQRYYIGTTPRIQMYTKFMSRIYNKSTMFLNRKGRSLQSVPFVSEFTLDDIIYRLRDYGQYLNWSTFKFNNELNLVDPGNTYNHISQEPLNSQFADLIKIMQKHEKSNKLPFINNNEDFIMENEDSSLQSLFTVKEDGTPFTAVEINDWLILTEFLAQTRHMLDVLKANHKETNTPIYNKPPYKLKNIFEVENYLESDFYRLLFGLEPLISEPIEVVSKSNNKKLSLKNPNRHMELLKYLAEQQIEQENNLGRVIPTHEYSALEEGPLLSDFEEWTSTENDDSLIAITADNVTSEKDISDEQHNLLKYLLAVELEKKSNLIEHNQFVLESEEGESSEESLTSWDFMPLQKFNYYNSSNDSYDSELLESTDPDETILFLYNKVKQDNLSLQRLDSLQKLTHLNIKDISDDIVFSYWLNERFDIFEDLIEKNELHTNLRSSLLPLGYTDVLQFKNILGYSNFLRKKQIFENITKNLYGFLDQQKGKSPTLQEFTALLDTLSTNPTFQIAEWEDQDRYAECDYARPRQGGLNYQVDSLPSILKNYYLNLFPAEGFQTLEEFKRYMVRATEYVSSKNIIPKNHSQIMAKFKRFLKTASHEVKSQDLSASKQPIPKIQTMARFKRFLKTAPHRVKSQDLSVSKKPTQIMAKFKRFLKTASHEVKSQDLSTIKVRSKTLYPPKMRMQALVGFKHKKKIATKYLGPMFWNIKNQTHFNEFARRFFWVMNPTQAGHYAQKMYVFWVRGLLGSGYNQRSSNYNLDHYLNVKKTWINIPLFENLMWIKLNRNRLQQIFKNDGLSFLEYPDKTPIRSTINKSSKTTLTKFNYYLTKLKNLHQNRRISPTEIAEYEYMYKKMHKLLYRSQALFTQKLQKKFVMHKEQTHKDLLSTATNNYSLNRINKKKAFERILFYGQDKNRYFTAFCVDQVKRINHPGFNPDWLATHQFSDIITDLSINTTDFKKLQLLKLLNKTYRKQDVNTLFISLLNKTKHKMLHKNLIQSFSEGKLHNLLGVSASLLSPLDSSARSLLDRTSNELYSITNLRDNSFSKSSSILSTSSFIESGNTPIANVITSHLLNGFIELPATAASIYQDPWFWEANPIYGDKLINNLFNSIDPEHNLYDVLDYEKGVISIDILNNGQQTVTSAFDQYLYSMSSNTAGIEYPLQRDEVNAKIPQRVWNLEVPELKIEQCTQEVLPNFIFITNTNGSVAQQILSTALPVNNTLWGKTIIRFFLKPVESFVKSRKSVEKTVEDIIEPIELVEVFEDIEPAVELLVHVIKPFEDIVEPIELVEDNIEPIEFVELVEDIVEPIEPAVELLEKGIELFSPKFIGLQSWLKENPTYCKNLPSSYTWTDFVKELDLQSYASWLHYQNTDYKDIAIYEDLSRVIYGLKYYIPKEHSWVLKRSLIENQHFSQNFLSLYYTLLSFAQLPNSINNTDVLVDRFKEASSLYLKNGNFLEYVQIFSKTLHKLFINNVLRLNTTVQESNSLLSHQRLRTYGNSFPLSLCKYLLRQDPNDQVRALTGVLTYYNTKVNDSGTTRVFVFEDDLTTKLDKLGFAAIEKVICVYPNSHINILQENIEEHYPSVLKHLSPKYGNLYTKKLVNLVYKRFNNLLYHIIDSPLSLSDVRRVSDYTNTLDSIITNVTDLNTRALEYASVGISDYGIQQGIRGPHYKILKLNKIYTYLLWNLSDYHWTLTAGASLEYVNAISGLPQKTWGSGENIPLDTTADFTLQRYREGISLHNAIFPIDIFKLISIIFPGATWKDQNQFFLNFFCLETPQNYIEIFNILNLYVNERHEESKGKQDDE